MDCLTRLAKSQKAKKGETGWLRIVLRWREAFGAVRNLSNGNGNREGAPLISLDCHLKIQDAKAMSGSSLALAFGS